MSFLREYDNLHDRDLYAIVTGQAENSAVTAAGALAEILHREHLSGGDLLPLAAFLLTRFDLFPKGRAGVGGNTVTTATTVELEERLSTLERRLDEALAGGEEEVEGEVVEEVAEPAAEPEIEPVPVTRAARKR